jgi:hypothetical protein
VPSSLRPAGSRKSAARPASTDPQDVRAGHERMLSDLAAFDDGIESARSEHEPDDSEDQQDPAQPEGQDT